MTRVVVVHNGEDRLARGLPADAAAVTGVREAASAVAGALREVGLSVSEVVASGDLARFAADLARAGADVAFNLVEAVGGEARLEAVAAGVLEWSGLPYTGSPPGALALALEKPVVRALLDARGIPVPEGAVLEAPDDPLPPLPWPVIVKPSREDASHGIHSESVVRDERSLRARAARILDDYGQPALVEEFVEGREFNLSILATAGVPRALPLAEIDFSRFPAGRPRLVTYEAKWVEGHPEFAGTVPVFPEDLDPALAERIRAVALAAFRAVGVRDYGRVDLRLHPRRGPVVLEVNPNPDLSPGAGLARAAARDGIDFPRLVRGILEEALARRPATAPAR